MKIFLINPAGVTLGLNLGLGYVASYLQLKNHSIMGLDLNNCRTKNPHSLISKYIKEYDPSVIGISVKSLTYKTSLEIAKSIKDFCKTPIVFGGIHASIAKQQILKNNSFLDFVLVGEGERTFCELVESIKNNGDLGKIKGLIFRDGNEIVSNEPGDLIINLNELPFPDYKCFGISRLKKYPILTSRGCPYNCSFCLVPKVSGKNWRARSPENIIEEIKQAKYIYEIKSIQIMDDNCCYSRERIVEFCDRYIQEELKFPWEFSNGVRVDQLDFNLVKLMKRAGLKSVSIGIESLHPKVFKQINKGESIDDIRNAVKILKEFEIFVIGFFIIGLPGDSYERTMYSYHEATKMKIDRLLFQILMPFPKTKVAEWVRNNARLFDNPDSIPTRLGEVTFETKDFTKEERKKAYIHLIIKNFIYPYDLNKTKIKNLFYLIKLTLQNDLANIHKHLYKFFIKSINIILTGSSATITGIYFKNNIFKR